MHIRVLLASKSPRRFSLLRTIGLEPVVVSSCADETVPDGLTDPEEIVRLLACRKAEGVSADAIREALMKADAAILLTADTVVCKDGRILGKPADEAEAAEMLSFLSGSWHTVSTGVSLRLLSPAGEMLAEDSFSVTTKVHVTALSEEDIRAYIASGEPMDKAGAYGIQGIFARHIDRIDGDYSNVVGLPVCEVYHRMKTISE